MKPRGEHPFARDALLRRQRDHGSSIRLPLPLSEYLDLLVVASDDAGEPTGRSELIAAMIANTEDSGDECARLVRQYKQMKCGELGHLFARDKIVYLSPPKPGRRRRDSV